MLDTSLLPSISQKGASWAQCLGVSLPRACQPKGCALQLSTMGFSFLRRTLRSCLVEHRETDTVNLKLFKLTERVSPHLPYSLFNEQQPIDWQGQARMMGKFGVFCDQPPKMCKNPNPTPNSVQGKHSAVLFSHLLPPGVKLFCLPLSHRRATIELG